MKNEEKTQSSEHILSQMLPHKAPKSLNNTSTSFGHLCLVCARTKQRAYVLMHKTIYTRLCSVAHKTIDLIFKQLVSMP